MEDSVLTHCDRRDVASRVWLLQRIRAEFQEMPCLRLTCAQARRLFGLPPGVSERLLAALVAERTLARGPDGRYALRDDAPRWRAQGSPFATLSPGGRGGKET
jgi:hypothetical protein